MDCVRRAMKINLYWSVVASARNLMSINSLLLLRYHLSSWIMRLYVNTPPRRRLRWTSFSTRRILASWLGTCTTCQFKSQGRSVCYVKSQSLFVSSYGYHQTVDQITMAVAAALSSQLLFAFLEVRRLWITTVPRAVLYNFCSEGYLDTRCYWCHAVIHMNIKQYKLRIK